MTRSAEPTAGTDGNELLTSATAAGLTVLLIAEGITILWLGALRGEHMFIGLVLIPPVLLKLGSTGYRFARYYTGSARYRAKGPPLLALRVLAPVLVAATALVFGSGVALLVIGPAPSSSARRSAAGSRSRWRCSPGSRTGTADSTLFGAHATADHR